MSNPPLRVEQPGQLLAFLVSALPGHKRTTLRNYMKHRSVRVNGVPATRHDHPLLPGDEVTLDTRASRSVRVMLPHGVKLLYEDEGFVVLQKPSGLLSLAAHPGDLSTAHAVINEYLGSRSPGGRAHVVHRIDKHTSGLLVFAKTSEMRAWFLDHWREIEKRYLAVVLGRPDPPEGTIRSYLEEDDFLKMHSHEEERAGTRLAVTHYKVVRTVGRFSLVEVRLETGRKNQIRVHMAEIGCPIAGDKKYGVAGKNGPGGRLALHAWRITFNHPGTHRPITVESPFPEMLDRLVPPVATTPGGGGGDGGGEPKNAAETQDGEKEALSD